MQPNEKLERDNVGKMCDNLYMFEDVLDKVKEDLEKRGIIVNYCFNKVDENFKFFGFFDIALEKCEQIQKSIENAT